MMNELEQIQQFLVSILPYLVGGGILIMLGALFALWHKAPEITTQIKPRLAMDLKTGAGRHYLFVFHPGDISKALGEKLIRDLNKKGISSSILRARGTPAVYDLMPDQLKKEIAKYESTT